MPRRRGVKYTELELGIGARSQQKTTMVGLPEGRKSFKIGLAVYTQYRRVTDSNTARHLSTAKTALAERRAGKN